MMKWICLAMLLVTSVCVVSPSLDHDDLRSLILGYLDGLEIMEDHNKLLGCLDDSLIAPWNEFIAKLKTIDNWNDKIKLMYAFAVFTIPALTSLGTILPCSKTEIANIYSRIKVLVNTPGELTKRVIMNIDVVIQSFQAFLQYIAVPNIFEAGNIAGGLVNFIFLNKAA